MSATPDLNVLLYDEFSLLADGLDRVRIDALNVTRVDTPSAARRLLAAGNPGAFVASLAMTDAEAVLAEAGRTGWVCLAIGDTPGPLAGFPGLTILTRPLDALDVLLAAVETAATGLSMPADRVDALTRQINARLGQR